MAFVPYPSTPGFHKFRKDALFSPGDRRENWIIRPRSGHFIGTIKLHGTNASMVFRNNNRKHPQFQSRNLIITPEKDNIGTAAFLCQAPLEALVERILSIRGVDTFEELFICGEFAGEGVQKGVAISSVPRFYAIFNIRIDGHWVDIRDYKTVEARERRIFNIANFDLYQQDIDFDEDPTHILQKLEQLTKTICDKCPVGAVFWEQLLQSGSAPKAERMVKGKKEKIVPNGEGLVWTLVPDATNDTTLWNFKTKGEQFFTTAYAPKTKQPPLEGDDLKKAEDFAKFALGERRLEQGLEYLIEHAKDPYDLQNIRMFADWVVGDVIKEVGWLIEEYGTNEVNATKIVTDKARKWFFEQSSR